MFSRHDGLLLINIRSVINNTKQGSLKSFFISNIGPSFYHYYYYYYHYYYYLIMYNQKEHLRTDKNYDIRQSARLSL